MRLYTQKVYRKTLRLLMKHGNIQINQQIMNNSTYPNNPQEAIFVPAQKCPYHVIFDLDLDLDLEHTLGAGLPGVHRVQVWWRSDHLPARSDGQCKFTQIQYIVYIVDKLIAILRSRERAK